MWSHKIKLSKMGNGAVVHISRVHIFDNGSNELKETLCVADAISSNSVIRPIKADAPTCKRCIKNKLADERDGIIYENFL